MTGQIILGFILVILFIFLPMLIVLVMQIKHDKKCKENDKMIEEIKKERKNARR